MSITITTEQLIKLGANQVNALKYVNHLNKYCNQFGINTNARVCAFLAQIFEETGALSIINHENLNYSAQRLMVVWPSRFPTLASTQGYVFNPVALAEKVYGGRGGNGVGNGDGLKFCGRGLIQLTFKSNYQACSKALGVDLVANPDLVLEPEFATASACWFFGSYANCNPVADKDNLDAVTAVTRIVNGGTGNLSIRVNYWKKAKQIWSN